MTETTQSRHDRIRIPVAEPRGVLGRVLTWYSRRAYGDVLDNALVLWHHRRALTAVLVMEKQVERLDALDAQLKTLAVMASAARIGCSWCLDFGHFRASAQGLDLAKVEAVPRWRGSDLYTPVERLVLEFAEAASDTPPTVSDQLVHALTGALGVPAVVELAMMVAVENQRSRFNSALGLTSQGFKNRCEVPG